MVSYQFFFKYEWGGGGSQIGPPEKTTLKSPALLGLMKQFLKDENGDVDAIKMRCLKPRAGLSTVIENTPDIRDHLHDIGFFKIQDAINTPFEVLPLRVKIWDVPHYEHVAEHFREVSGLGREALKNMQ